MAAKQVFATIIRFNLLFTLFARRYIKAKVLFQPTQAVTPKAPARAEATAMMILKTISHTFLCLPCSFGSLLIRFILQIHRCFLLLSSPVPASWAPWRMSDW